MVFFLVFFWGFFGYVCGRTGTATRVDPYSVDTQRDVCREQHVLQSLHYREPFHHEEDNPYPNQPHPPPLPPPPFPLLWNQDDSQTLIHANPFHADLDHRLWAPQSKGRVKKAAREDSGGSFMASSRKVRVMLKDFADQLLAGGSYNGTGNG